MNESQIASTHRHLELVIAILLALLAFAVRIDGLGFNSLSEDETAKWRAIQQYRQGHFAGVNSEHPMLPKVLAWGSIEIGERWNRIAFAHHWPQTAPESWLRLPYVLFGAATAAVLFLLCRQVMGVVGAFSAGLFWAVSPLTVALNRLAKEETPFTFFTVLGCCLYCHAKLSEPEKTRRWVDLSAMAFGLATASQYMIHVFGLNQLGWHMAGRNGVDRKPLGRLHFRILVLIGLVFLLADPVILSSATINGILHWLHHGGIHHSGYNFNGTLYLNFPSLMLAGVPWYFYFWLLLTKTPIPILVAMIIGGVLLLRNRRTLASCLFVTLGLGQLIGLSVCGAKWIRYSLPFLPFLYLGAGYAVQKGWEIARKTETRLVAAAMAVMVLGMWPLVELRNWTPYYPFYLNSIGGGAKNIARYFSPDEVSEFDTREVAQLVCPVAPPKARLATGRPDSMMYYLERCGRPDIEVVPLYDRAYTPRTGDVIVLESSRRFVETEQFFFLLERSPMTRRQIHVGPVAASTVYLFRQTGPVDEGGAQNVILARQRDSRVLSGANAHGAGRSTAQSGALERDSF